MRSPKSARPVKPRCHSVEALEARIAPAAVTSPATFTYTDGDGDLVNVQIVGKGSVQFLDGSGADLADHAGNLGSVVISKAGPDFALYFSDANTTGDNVIQLGKVAGLNGARLPQILGIFTADSSAGVRYELGGYTGTTFAPGGGLKILGALTGDGVGATIDLDLKQVLPGTTVHLRDGITSDATATIAGKVGGYVKSGEVAGSLLIGSVAGSGTLELGHISGNVAIRKGMGGRILLGDAPAGSTADALETLTIGGNFAPNGVISSQQDVTLIVGKNASGFINVGGDLNLAVTGLLSGATINAGDDMKINVTGAVSGSAVVAGQGILVGSTLGAGVTSSEFLGGNGANLGIVGSVRTSRFSGGVASLTVGISGSLFSSQLLGGGDDTVTIGFSVSDSSILADGRLELRIGQQPQGGIAGLGNLLRSTVGSKSTSALVVIGGKVSASQLMTATTLDVTAGGVMDANVLQSGNDLFLKAAADVSRSRVVAGSDASITIGGQMASSALLISNNLDLTVGRTGLPVVLKKKPLAGVVDSRVETSDGNANVTVIGPIARTLFESGQDVTVVVSDLVGLDQKTNQPKILRQGEIRTGVLLVGAGAASITSTSDFDVAARLFAGASASVTMPGLFTGSITAADDVLLSAGSLKLAANFINPPTGTYAAAAVPAPITASGSGAVPPSIPGSGNSVQIVSRGGLRVGGDLTLLVSGNAIAPLVEVAGDVIDFQVDGKLSTRMYVSGNFVAGTPTASATVVGGVVAPSTLLRIGGNFGDADSTSNYVFAAGFGGRLEIGGALQADLTFQGATKRIVIDGGFSPVGTNSVVDIIVQGQLKSLVTSSLFTRTSPNGGVFASGGAAGQGAVQATGGAMSVGPFTTS